MRARAAVVAKQPGALQRKPVPGAELKPREFGLYPPPVA